VPPLIVRLFQLSFAWQHFSAIFIYQTNQLRKEFFESLNTAVFITQKHFDGIPAFSGSLSISIRILQSFSPVMAKSHFEVMERVITPEIKFFHDPICT
jgi:hypothetical protein